MTLDILQSISRMLMDKAMQQMIDMGINALMNFGNAGVAPSQQSGGFGGFFADGGTLGAGKWGIAGENGPEVIQGPANVVPMTGGGMKVTINNIGGAQVRTQERDSGNGRELMIMVDARIARQMADPYSGSSPALAARGARAPMKRR